MSSSTFNQPNLFPTSIGAGENSQSNSRVPEEVVVFRVVVAFLLASLLWKSSHYPAVYSVYVAYSLKHSFFPDFLSNTFVLGLLLVIPVALGAMAMLVRQKGLLIVQASVTVLCMFGMCIHQGSYNDVTFLTCFWVALWCLWYSVKLGSPPRALIEQSKTFAILIISLIFLGGAVGKWTPGYWSGQVLYEIYFVDRDFWFFNLLRTSLEPEALRDFATCYSRLVVLAESGCALLWLLPVKLAGTIALAMLVGIVLFSNTHLFSVMFCLCGLAIVCLHEPKKQS